MSYSKEEPGQSGVISLATSTGLQSMIEAHLYFEELQSGLGSIFILGDNAKEMWCIVDWHRYILSRWIELKKKGHRGSQERWVPIMDTWINIIDAVFDLMFNYALPSEHHQRLSVRESPKGLNFRNMVTRSPHVYDPLTKDDKKLLDPIINQYQAWTGLPHPHEKPFRKLVAGIRRTIKSNLPKERLQLQRQRGIESSDFQNFTEEIDEKIKQLIALLPEEEQEELYFTFHRVFKAAIHNGAKMDSRCLRFVRSLIDTWLPSSTACRKDIDAEFRIHLQIRFDTMISPHSREEVPTTKDVLDTIALGADVRGGVMCIKDYSLWEAAGSLCPIGVFKALVDLGAPYTMESDQLQSPLHAAVKEGNIDIVAFLLDSKNHSFQLDVNYRDERGKTALHVAAGHCRRRAVDLLLQHPDIDANAQDRFDNTPLLTAVQVEPGTQDKYAVLKKLLEDKRVDRSSESKIYSDMSHYASALHYAAMLRDATLAIVLRYVRSINAETTEGETPLHFAVRANSKPNVNMLLKRGANPNVICIYGYTPLQLACEERQLGAMEELLSIQQSLVNQWPLPIEDPSIGYEAREAKYHGSPVTLVLRDMSDATRRKRGRFQLALELILKAKPNLEFRDGNGRSVLSVLILDYTWIDRDILLTVLRAGANVNSRDDNGDTPLHLLISQDSYIDEAFKILLRWGADPEITNKKGQNVIAANPTHFLIDSLVAMVKDLNLESQKRNDGRSFMTINAKLKRG
ncbi:MAG: hypothetical protein Q9195_004081 [Heterodermia aff. obscurata]